MAGRRSKERESREVALANVDLGAADRGGRRFDVIPKSITYIIHRQATSRWSISDLHHDDALTLAYAADGRAHYRCGNERADISAGEMLLFDRGVPHSASADESKPWRFYSVVFQVAPVEPADRDSERAVAALPWHVQAENRIAAEALFAELDARWASREVGYELRCRAILLTLLHMYVEATTKRAYEDVNAHGLLRIARHLQEHYDRDFSVSELAARAGLSESRFRVLFKRTMGVSVVRYHNALRVNRARSLLLSGEHSVTEVARLIGIEDVYYFSRLFKKVTGTNPSSLIPK